MITRELAKKKYGDRVDSKIVDAFLYDDAINEKWLDEQLQYLVIPRDVCHLPTVNKVFPEIQLRHEIQAAFVYTNRFPERLISVYAESRSAELCRVLSPTRTFPERIAFGQKSKIRLIFTPKGSLGFHAVAELLIKDAFTNRLLERLHFPLLSFSDASAVDEAILTSRSRSGATR